MSIDIYAYSDYRALLKDLYADMKRKNSFLTYGSIAKRAGFKSRGFLTQVLQGKSNLSGRMILRFAEAFGMQGKDREYFELLVHFDQAKSGSEKRFHLEKIRGAKGFRVKGLHASQAELHEHWYHIAIRSLIGIGNFREGQHAEIARELRPAISPTEAKRSVETLERLGLIKRNADGVWVLCENFITTGPEADPIRVDGYKVQVLDLAKEALDRMPRNIQNTSTLTLAVSGSAYPAILEKIAALRKELLEMADREDSADRVYQVNFSAFPVTQLPEDRP